METDVLRWFQQVADGVTVTEVAAMYTISQPAVSRALARLEHDVGTPLLLKSGRTLRPTHAGSIFKGHVDAVMHRLDDGLAALDELAAPETGTVTVAFHQSLGTWLVPDLISRFRLQHPQVQFRLEQSQDALGSSLVADGRVDLEFTARRPRNPDVHWERLLPQPLGLAVPADHQFATRTTIALAEAAEENFLMMGKAWEFRALCDQLCAAAGFAPHVAFETDDLTVILGFVAAGLGVAVVPTTPADAEATGVRGHRIVRLTDDGASRHLGMAWSRTRRLLPSAELFRVAVLNRFKRPTNAGR